MDFSVVRFTDLIWLGVPHPAINRWAIFKSSANADVGNIFVKRPKSQFPSVFPQLAPQLRSILEKNCCQPQFARALQIYFSVIDENTLRRLALSYLQCGAIDRLVRFSDSQKTRAEENGKKALQSELFD